MRSRARKCASGEGLNSRSLCLPKCERACPALMRSCGCTFASGEGLNSLHMCCHKCPCVRSAWVRMCALMRAGWRGAELVLHVCSEMDACAPGMHAVARAQVREWRGAQLAMHVRSQVQARKHVRACGLYILFFSPCSRSTPQSSGATPASRKMRLTERGRSHERPRRGGETHADLI